MVLMLGRILGYFLEDSKFIISFLVISFQSFDSNFVKPTKQN